MPILQALRSYFAEPQSLQMQADGFAMRLVWSGEKNPVVVQTLEDYGGMSLAEDSGQALWFFFSTDILLAAARLAVWARFNTLGLTMQIFPARLQAGRRKEQLLIFDESIWQSELPPPLVFTVWIHKSMAEQLESMAGLGLKEEVKDNPDPQIWAALEADTRLPYQSPLSWVAVIRPVGGPHDKNFHVGWREFFSQLEAVLQRNKLRYSVHDSYIMFPLETLKRVKAWCRDFLGLIRRLKTESSQQYWPCVTAIVERKGLALNEELPGKLHIAWEHLIPDYPHMTMGNALMLGNEFSVHEVRFAPSRQIPDDWASISLADDSGTGTGDLPQLAPVQLTMGHHEQCFYCGQRSHESAQCPSRLLTSAEPSVWPKVARLDFDAMRKAVADIEQRLGKADDDEARASLVAAQIREDDEDTVMLKSFYDTVWPVQLRAVDFFWRARNKDLKKAAKNLAQPDNSPAWSLLEEFSRLSPEENEEALKPLTLKHSKDFKTLSLRGFAAMERGEGEKAEKFWKEAELASPHPIVQAWHGFLQARSLECRGLYTEASFFFDQLSRACPTWLDAEYRKAVCMIKSGFTEPALALLVDLINKSGHFFNKAILDPELERGYIQVLSTLNGLWGNMARRAVEEEGNLLRLREDLAVWFLPDNEFAGRIAERIDKVLQLASIRNYVTFQMLSAGRAQIERDIQTHVMLEAKSYKNRFKVYGERLRIIHEESAWFPFPGTLVEFNRSYNEGVANLNWAMTANFHTPEAFRKAQTLMDKEGERVKKLEKRLRFLRIVRDGTLFILSMVQTFLWLEIIGIILIFMVLPLLLYYGDKLGFEQLTAIISRDRWLVQKALFIVVTLLAIGIAALRTLFSFERIRDKILAKAKENALRPNNKKTRPARRKK
ncbi:tetratricopeptide repeat protein [Desulfovibrio sp. OttesenSCG-928-F20]|nr:tetratricopeptide repeat protein [Desulfovibrio sp. OttesenSCG-928-F20]